MPKCTFLMDADTGGTCGCNARVGKTLCVSHDPESRAEQQANRAKGGRNSRRASHPLASCASILQTLEDLLKRTLSKEPLPAPQTQAALRACDLALKVLDAGEWTDRMAALEKKIAEEEKRRAQAIRDAAEAGNWGDPEPQVFLPPQPDDPSWLHRGPGMWVGGKWVYTGETAGTQMNADKAGCTQMTARDPDGNGGERDDPTPATVGPDGLATSGSRRTIRPVQRPGEEGEGGRESEFAPTRETADGRREPLPAPTGAAAARASSGRTVTDYALVRGPDGVLRPTLVILEPGKPPRYGPQVGNDVPGR